MVVTAIRQTSPDRVSVELEDGSVIRSSTGVITSMRLFQGRDLDEEQLEELRLNSLRSIARDRAIRIASTRQMSKKELRDKLIQKGEDRDTAEYCADWLAENGLINDEGYAAAVARHYAAKGYGAARVRAELCRRGISRDYWDEALEELPEVNPKLDRLIASRAPDPDDRDEMRKLTASLYRRGFSRSEIQAAFARYFDALETEPDGDPEWEY